MKNNSVIMLLNSDELSVFKLNLSNILKEVDKKFKIKYVCNNHIFDLSIEHVGSDFNPLLQESYVAYSNENVGLGLESLLSIIKWGLHHNFSYSYKDGTSSLSIKVLLEENEADIEGECYTLCDPNLFSNLVKTNSTVSDLNSCLRDIAFIDYKQFLSEYIHNVTLYSGEAKPLLIPFFSFNLTTSNKEEFITNIHKGKYICNTTKELSLIAEEWFKELGIEGYVINVTT